MSSKENSEVNPIEQWQESVPDGEAPPSPTENNHGLTGQLSTNASSLFLSTMKSGKDHFSEEVLLRIRREYGYFQLWCDGYGVLSGELDDILAGATRLRNSTYRSLVDVCQALLGLNTVISRPNPTSPVDEPRFLTQTKELLARTISEILEGDDSDSDTYSDVGPLEEDIPSSTPERLVDDLATGIECLVDLGPCFDEPVLDALPDETAVALSESSWDPIDLLAARVSHRYPGVDNKLARALGSANWERLQRLVQTREDNMQPKEQPPPKRKDTTSATSAAASYHDSGIGTSITAPTIRYAETVLSYHGSKGGSIRIPSAPAEGLRGQPFTCEICAVELQIPVKQAKSLWKKHVFSDLRPYTCIKPICDFSSVQFTDKQSWIDHLVVEHRMVACDAMECPLCGDGVHSNQFSHLACHLEEISLTILSANVEDGNPSSDDEEEVLEEATDKQEDGGEEEGKEKDNDEDKDKDNNQTEPPGSPKKIRATRETAPTFSHRKGPWLQNEDASLMRLVKDQVPRNWIKISQALGTRTPKQCRERYVQNLKPLLNRDPITQEEGILIQRYANETGKDWAEIARRMPGRSKGMIQNWYAGMNRRKSQDRKKRGLDGEIGQSEDLGGLDTTQKPGLPYPARLYLPPLAEQGSYEGIFHDGEKMFASMQTEVAAAILGNMPISMLPEIIRELNSQ